MEEPIDETEIIISNNDNPEVELYITKRSCGDYFVVVAFIIVMIGILVLAIIENSYYILAIWIIIIPALILMLIKIWNNPYCSDGICCGNYC